MNRKIVVADDDADICQVISILLTSNGYDVTAFTTSSEVIPFLKKTPSVDLVVLDLMMPGVSGLDVLKGIRTFSSVPVLCLTAKTAMSDKSDAYDSGADDYLSKPFSQKELLLKVSSLVRRYRDYNQLMPSPVGSYNGISVDSEHRKVLKNGTDVALTDKEYELFRFLLLNRGTPQDVKSIYEAVWGFEYLPSAANTVMVHILNLRRKLEDDPSKPVVLKTVWGKGYQIGE